MHELIEEYNINLLAHFTNVENLQSILEHGLLPRDTLDTLQIEYSYNDNFRYDNCTNAVCTSISFPNYKMFYPLRQENPSINWVVLGLDIDIINDFDCAFCTRNAGSEEMYSININKRKGINAFRKLYDELSQGPSREKLGIPRHYPTNPQSEVLVFDRIPVNYIKIICFYDDKTHSKYEHLIPDSIKSEVNTKVFKGRRDWMFWQKD